MDATEIFVEQPAITELQKLTYYKYIYKNNNTYNGLIGISPSGAMTFVSDLYPGSISDKTLIRKSGLLQVLFFVASALNTSVGVVVMSQIICIAPSPCLVVPPSYLLRIITSSSL